MEVLTLFIVAESIVQSLQSLQEGDADQVAQRTSEILGLAFDSHAKNKIMDVILTSCKPSWTKWCNNDGVAVVWDENHSAANDHSRMLDYLVNLLGHVDYSDLFGESDQSTGRPWLAVEMLCECQVVDTKYESPMVNQMAQLHKPENKSPA